MKFTLRGASSAAILAGLAGSLPVWAQETAPAPQVDQTAPQAAPQRSEDRVVVTGSLIAGTAVDTALPVEVYSAEALQEQGSPTALEFVKTLTISGPTAGEAYYFSGAANIGSPQFNLRGIGADKTLTLLNGRRMSENASNIPGAAIARIEILKDGAAVTYGADATGGVVNFITREDFNGLEINGQYKYIDGSDGDYGLTVLGGFGEGDTNFLWSAEWEHRSTLDPQERDWAVASFDFGTNPAPWSTLTNLAAYYALGAYPNSPSTNTYYGEFGNPIRFGGSFGPPGAGLALTARPFSDFTQPSCEAVGGSYASSTACRYNYISYYNLVEENDIFRGYAQLNTAVSDNVDFHVEASYGLVSTPKIFGSPSQPVVQGSGRSDGLVAQFYVPRANPGFMDFATRSGLATHPLFNQVEGLTPITYRPLAHGGNPVLGGGDGFGVPTRVNNQSWRVMGELSGTLGDWAGVFSDTNFQFSGTYNNNQLETDAADVIAYRLQEALAGFGGPNCAAADLNPLQFGTQNPAAAGKNGCLWWNPFASNFPNQPERGLANPNYVPGLENDASLYNWITDPRKQETQTTSLTVDFILSGDTPIELPGGTVQWGLGTQWRTVEFRETVESDIYNGNLACNWPSNFTTGVNGAPITQTPRNPADPLYTGCTPDEPGPFLFFGTNKPDASDRQQFSYFGELNIPVFDRLNLQAAVRREDFSGDLGATVYKVSGKWDVFGPISLRGSYGTNYQTPPLGIIPGEVQNLVRSYTAANNNWKAYQRITDSGLQPETATAWNAGVIWQSQGFAPDHDFQLIVDYFNIETEDEIGDLATHNQVLEAAFSNAALVNGAGFRLATDCAHPFVTAGRIRFSDTPTSPGGTCINGVTSTDDFSVVQSVQGNAFGQTTTGFDIQARYSLPLGPGDLSFDVTGTKVEELTTTERTLDGIVVAPGDTRNGFLNFSTIAFAAPEWRVNGSGTYRWDRHTVRAQVNYVSAVQDERPGMQYGEFGEEWLTGDVHYLFDLTDTFRLTLSVVNIFDEDPPAAQEELGYDPLLGSPLGRTFEIGVKKTF